MAGNRIEYTAQKLPELLATIKFQKNKSHNSQHHSTISRNNDHTLPDLTHSFRRSYKRSAWLCCRESWKITWNRIKTCVSERAIYVPTRDLRATSAANNGAPALSRPTHHVPTSQPIPGSLKKVTWRVGGTLNLVRTWFFSQSSPPKVKPVG